MFISEIAKTLKLTTRTIRHYEEIGLIKSIRLKNNYRFYDIKNIDRLRFLTRARKLGFSLKECEELIKLFDNNERKSVNVRNIAKNKLKKINIQLKDLKDLKESLEWLVKRCPGNDKPNCPIIDELAND